MTQASLFDQPPAQRHSPTSVAAAIAMQPKLPAAQARVLEVIAAAGERGCTDNEGIAITGMVNGWRARRTELVRAGLIADSGATRLGSTGLRQTVWITK